MLKAIGDVMRRMYERGWITTRDGNISMRKREGKYLYITPSGWRKTIVHPEHVVRIEIVREPSTKEQTLKVREDQHPSGELWIHWNLQQAGRKTRTVRACPFHAHRSRRRIP
jgi:ribulose-5-phosphate 4-epimerase/fuculose-1-phosphate aldolase